MSSDHYFSENQPLVEDNEQDQYEYASETEEESPERSQEVAAPQPAPRTMQRARQNRAQQQQQPLPPQVDNQQMVPMEQRQTGNMGGRTGAIRESRIKDRPQPKESRDSSLKIKIELDLEVEVDLYARVKGDVTIGLMWCLFFTFFFVWGGLNSNCMCLPSRSIFTPVLREMWPLAYCEVCQFQWDKDDMLTNWHRRDWNVKESKEDLGLELVAGNKNFYFLRSVDRIPWDWELPLYMGSHLMKRS